MTKMTKMKKMKKKNFFKIKYKFFFKKKKLSEKNFTKKSIKNYQKLNNKLSGNGQTDRPTDRHSDI